MNNMLSFQDKQSDRELVFLFRLLECFWVGSSLALCSIIWKGNIWQSDFYLMLASLSMLLYFVFADMQGLYRSWRVVSISIQIKRLFNTWIWVAIILLTVGFLLKITSSYSRLVITTWLIITPFILSTQRLFLYKRFMKWQSQSDNMKSAVIVGNGEHSRQFAKTLSTTPEAGIRIIGYYDTLETMSDEQLRQNSMFPLLGVPEQVVKDAADGKMEIVYLALPGAEEVQMRKIINELSDTTVSVSVLLSDLYSGLLYSGIKHLNEFIIVSIYETPFDDLNAFLKRIEDIVVSSIVLCIVALPMLIIALLIKLTSPGPVFFKQFRYGFQGETINIWKFRSMTVCENREEVKQVKKNDCRVTPLGAFLRRTSLDELPQFFNVLQGRMSVVGPRPHAVIHNEMYRKLVPGYMMRHKVKPGITGWAQINGWRGETDILEKMRKRVEYDLDYIKNWSLFLDFKIILLTIFKGLIGKNAY